MLVVTTKILDLMNRTLLTPFLNFVENVAPSQQSRRIEFYTKLRELEKNYKDALKIHAEKEPNHSNPPEIGYPSIVSNDEAPTNIFGERTRKTTFYCKKAYQMEWYKLDLFLHLNLPMYNRVKILKPDPNQDELTQILREARPNEQLPKIPIRHILRYLTFKTRMDYHRYLETVPLNTRAYAHSRALQGHYSGPIQLYYAGVLHRLYDENLEIRLAN